MSKGILLGVGLVVTGFILLALSGAVSDQASVNNQTMGQTPATQITGSIGDALFAIGVLSLIIGFIIVVISFSGG